MIKWTKKGKEMIEEEIKKLIKNAAKRYLAGDFKLFIFGSRATRENRIFSDIDVGILAGGRIPGRTIIKIQEELEEREFLLKSISLILPRFQTNSGTLP